MPVIQYRNESWKIHEFLYSSAKKFLSFQRLSIDFNIESDSDLWPKNNGFDSLSFHKSFKKVEEKKLTRL